MKKLKYLTCKQTLEAIAEGMTFKYNPYLGPTKDDMPVLQMKDQNGDWCAVVTRLAHITKLFKKGMVGARPSGKLYVIERMEEEIGKEE